MKKLKIGVFGAGVRGRGLARTLLTLNCDIVALCELVAREEELQKTAKEMPEGVAIYHDFDEFINHEMDAVILTNFFNEHAPYAIKCFEKGLHVLSECISNGTMGEGVDLIRAFEKSNSVYMLAENYPQMKFNREMKRVCDSGALGRVLFAEGEYNHPVSRDDEAFKKDYVYYDKHWRNYLPGTYYVTHSLGPIMRATGATPKKVASFECLSQYDEKFRGDMIGKHMAIMTTQNDDGSVFRITGCARFGGHHNAYRICGTKGQIENLRGMHGQIMLRYNPWDTPEGEEPEKLYTPEWNDKDEELIKASGHGGGDYLTLRMFIECIKEGKQPEHPFDIYSAVAMSSVAILGHRSLLEGGVPYDIPDFHNEEDRKKYENDRLTPFFGPDGSKPTIPCCSVAKYTGL
jgi:predicted dehydrogenase